MDIEELIPNLEWLRQQLEKWFSVHHRNYVWRETSDPYKILVAEILLRRTWARQVEAVYEKFIGLYPDIPALARASPAQLRGLLWSLGLHNKADELLSIARELLDKHDGEVPRSRTELNNLPGVGDYVAGAVLSMAFNKPEWIVDTNVVRVFRRFFGLDLPPEARRSKPIIQLASIYAQTEQSGRANLALLDHAALVCQPRTPKCGECSLAERCNFIVPQ